MMDKIVSVLAPHTCLMCGTEGRLLCSDCYDVALEQIPSRCYKCFRLTDNNRVCSKCRRSSSLKNVHVVSTLDGPAKDLIYKIKFERVKAAIDIIVEYMNTTLPDLSQDTIITYVPTATSRVRLRGYDHIELIAKSLAVRRGLNYAPLFVRIGQSSQVGSNRKARLEQAGKSYQYSGKAIDKTAPVLIIDDILTTGATVEACAAILKQSGHKNISAAVFAQTIE